MKEKGKFLTITNNSKIQLFPASLNEWNERSKTHFEALINSLRSGIFKQQKDLLILFIEFLYSIDSKKDALNLLSKDTGSLLETLKTTKSEPFTSDHKSNQMDSEENQKMMIKSAKIFLEFMQKATIGQYSTFKDDNTAIDPTQLCDFYIIHPECKFQFAFPMLVEMNDLYGGNCGLYYNLSCEADSQVLFMKFMNLYHSSMFIRLSEESDLVNVIAPEDSIFIYRGLYHFNTTIGQMLDLKSQINDEVLEDILNSGLANPVAPNLLITKTHLYVNWKEGSNNMPWSSKKTVFLRLILLILTSPPQLQSHVLMEHSMKLLKLIKWVVCLMDGNHTLNRNSTRKHRSVQQVSDVRDYILCNLHFTKHYDNDKILTGNAGGPGAIQLFFGG